MMDKKTSLIIQVLSIVLFVGSQSHEAAAATIEAVVRIEINFPDVTNVSYNITTPQLSPTTEQPSTPKLTLIPSGGDGNSFIYYRTNVNKSVHVWTNKIDHILKPYQKQQPESHVHCSYNRGPAGEHQSCEVPLDEFYPCTRANNYNYEKGAPCIFLKLDKILNWEPEPYNNAENLPEDMPLDLKQFLRITAGRPESNNVWATCKGETEADEKLLGPIQYIPWRGFPLYYFQNTNNKNFLNPVVAVLIERPKKGVVIGVQCRAWARNLPQSATVRLQLMVDGE